MKHIVILYPVGSLHKIIGPISSSIQIEMEIWVFSPRLNSIIILGIIPSTKLIILIIENHQNTSHTFYTYSKAKPIG
jgi:hypothetical protein